MTEDPTTATASPPALDIPSDSVEALVRAAFTERIHAELTRLLADSLEATRAVSPNPVARGESRRMRQEAAAHDREAHSYEERAAMLRQLEHDGWL